MNNQLFNILGPQVISSLLKVDPGTPYGKAANAMLNMKPEAGQVIDDILQNALKASDTKAPQYSLMPPEVKAITDPRNSAQSGYDMWGYIDKYGVPDQSNGQHLTDEFKLPNHPTFSDESRYSVDTPTLSGGHWTPPDNKWTFAPSAMNMAETPIPKLMAESQRGEGFNVQMPSAGQYGVDTIPTPSLAMSEENAFRQPSAGMGSNNPSTSQGSANIGGKDTSMIFGIPVNDFARMAFMVAQAVAPKEWSGRLGTSGIQMLDYKDKMDLANRAQASEDAYRQSEIRKNRYIHGKPGEGFYDLETGKTSMPFGAATFDELAKLNQKDWTPASWQQYMLTKDRSVLEPIGKISTTPYGDFASGYKSMLKVQHPEWDEPKINLETANEAERRGINKSVQVAVAGGQARGEAYANERFYSMFDTKLGKTVKVKGYALNGDNGGRYLDPQDPTFKADSGSLTKITKGMDSVNAFEKGASQALDYALTVAKDYNTGKYPKANNIVQLFQYHAGDPKVKGLRNAITTAATEYMKVINAGSDLTASELSVMGQNRAKEIIEGSDNIESIANSIKIMKREMQISGDKFTAQRREIQGRLGSYNPSGPAPSSPNGGGNRPPVTGARWSEQYGAWFVPDKNSKSGWSKVEG